LDSVSYQDYPGRGKVDSGRNVIGQINGTTTPKEIVIIGCHIDDQPWGEPVSPGADDNASGCSALLYLVRTFAGKTFARTIRFVFFGSKGNAPWTGVGVSYGSGYYRPSPRARTSSP
jgi:Zn-dependent M28 family amino/carboxypeptidase